MEKLELKHLAPYLPYGLKVKTIGIYEDEPYFIMSSRYKIQEVLIHDVIEYQDKYFKPILRPLSDLTKDIEHNGERFNPYYRLNIYQNDIYRLSKNGLHNCEFPLGLYLALIEWHFDVFGLIDKGLSIDINTIK